MHADERLDGNEIRPRLVDIILYNYINITYLRHLYVRLYHTYLDIAPTETTKHHSNIMYLEL